MYVAGTDEQLKTCQPDILQMHEAQSRSRRAEPMQCIKSDIGWWWWWGLIMQRKIIIRCSYAFQTGPIKNKTLPSAKC